MRKTLHSLKRSKSKGHNFCKNHSTITKVELKLELFIVQLHTKNKLIWYIVGALHKKVQKTRMDKQTQGRMDGHLAFPCHIMTCRGETNTNISFKNNMP